MKAGESFQFGNSISIFLFSLIIAEWTRANKWTLKSIVHVGVWVPHHLLSIS